MCCACAKHLPEAVLFHAMPVAVAEEILHAHDAQAVIDSTAGDGAWALACMRLRKPYTGIVFSQRHAGSLMAWLEWAVLQGM